MPSNKFSKGSRMSLKRFTGKTVVITGAGTGIGRAAAMRLSEEGALCVLVGRRQAPLDEVAAEIGKIGGSALVMACNIADEENLQMLMREAAGSSGRIDGLFANAGVLGAFKPLEEADAADFHNLVATNIVGTFLTVKFALPYIHGGAVAINASWTVKGVMPGAGAYAASKGSLIAMMKTFAMEQGRRSVRVNSISPGIVLTPMADEVLDPEFSSKLAAHSPLGRNGAPDDIAGTVAWLLSDDARFVTGQDILIDGGFTLAGPRM